jgi:hypothetical protein
LSALQHFGFLMNAIPAKAGIHDAAPARRFRA